MSKTCNICRKEMQPAPMGDRDGYTFIACNVCGSVYVDPWIEKEEQEKFYGEIQPQITHVPKPFAEIAALTKKFKSMIPAGATGRRFLDVSCRNGYAVAAAKELGFDAKGIDAHEFFVEFAQKTYGANLFAQSTAMDYAAAGHQAEFIFARECICEQTDPDAFIAALAKMLTPGGTLYIEEPDGNHFNTPNHFPNWEIVFPPMNLAYYSKKSLGALLKRHGLKVKKTAFSWRPLMRLTVTKS